MYTGRHVPVTQVYDNDNMHYVRPLDPALGRGDKGCQQLPVLIDYFSKGSIPHNVVVISAPHGPGDVGPAMGWRDLRTRFKPTGGSPT